MNDVYGKWAEGLWQQAEYREMVDLQVRRFKDWFSWSVEYLLEEKRGELMIILWLMWNCRNNFVFRNEFFTAMNVSAHVLGLLKNFRGIRM